MENRDVPPHEVTDVHLRRCGGRGGGLLDCRSSSRTGRSRSGDSWRGSGRPWGRRIARAGSWCTGCRCETTIDRGRARCWCTGHGSRAGGRCGGRWSRCPPRRWRRSTGGGNRAGGRGWWRRPRSLVSAGYPLASSRWGCINGPGEEPARTAGSRPVRARLRRRSWRCIRRCRWARGLAPRDSRRSAGRGGERRR